MIGATRYIASAEIARQARLSADMTQLQESISSNKRLSAGSDDAAAAARIAEIRQTQADHATWTTNANTGAAIAGAADAALSSVATVFDRAKELILQGRNGTNNGFDRGVLATEMRGLAADLDRYALTQDPQGRPLFPTTAPIAIPVSATLSVSATDSKTNVFDTVTTAAGTKSLSDILNDAASALVMADGATIPKVDGMGVPLVDANGDPITIGRDEAMTNGIAAIDAGLDHVTDARTHGGIRAQRFDDAKQRLANEDVDLADERSTLEDTDLPTAISTFQAKSLALQAAQTVYAQAHKRSLFDLLG